MLDAGRQLDWQFDPLGALRRWPADRRVMLLHSGRRHERWARRSVLAEPGAVYRFDETGPRQGVSRIHNAGRASTIAATGAAFEHHPLRDLRRVLALDDMALWIGYLSYDLGRWIERLPQRAARDRDWPIVELAHCPGWLVHDTLTGRWRACGAWADGGFPLLDRLPPLDAPFQTGGPVSVFTQSQHEAVVRRGIEYIAAGDVFQVNLAQRFTAELDGEYPLAQRALFGRLAAVSPAWYGAYLELGGDDGDADGAPGRVIASTSPELFLEVDAQRRVVTRPIKGTAPSHVDPAVLRRSVKDTAELNMIVDLLRNDLGRVCDYGSIRVAEPRAIESHPTVHHGVATIEGRLHASKDVVDLLRATLPGGSVTGAPKVRAMQIIDELEPVRRGPYCGCIGVLSRDFSCLNIAIRTMLLEPAHGRVDFSVGGGIVADSTPTGEYEETLDKAQAMMRALGPATTAPPSARSGNRPAPSASR